MSLQASDVRHIAMLARLELTAEEEAAFTEQLDHILTYFEKLQQLDTERIEPTAHIGETATRFREDEVRNTPAVNELMANAPLRDAQFFKVPKIIE